MTNLRLRIWAIVIAICIALSALTSFAKWCFKEKTPYTICIDSDDIILKERFKNISSKNYDLTLTSDPNEADMIIARHDKDKTIDKFSKKNNYLYTPFMIFTNNSNITSEWSDLQVIDQNAVCDLKKILEVIESDGKLTDVGIDDDNKISLFVPSKETIYYDDVIKLFLINLYDTPTTAKNKAERMERVSAIIAKCQQISNFESKFSDYTSSKNYNLFLVPECEYAAYYYSNDSNYKSCIYFIDEHALTYDIYANDEITQTVHDDVFDILSEKGFTKIGYRVVNHDLPSGYFIQSLNVRNGDDFFQ